MNQKFKVKTDLGNKLLVRATCVICEGSYFEVIKKGKRKEPDTFICEECKERINSPQINSSESVRPFKQ